MYVNDKFNMTYVNQEVNARALESILPIEQTCQLCEIVTRRYKIHNCSINRFAITTVYRKIDTCIYIFLCLKKFAYFTTKQSIHFKKRTIKQCYDQMQMLSFYKIKKTMHVAEKPFHSYCSTVFFFPGGILLQLRVRERVSPQ